MSKSLEALQDLSKLVFVYGGVEQYKLIEKHLKALEIIKEKGLSLIHKSLIISSKSYEEYRQEFQLAKSRIFKNEYFYSREEYDLSKEVLK